MRNFLPLVILLLSAASAGAQGAQIDNATPYGWGMMGWNATANQSATTGYGYPYMMGQGMMGGGMMGGYGAGCPYGGMMAPGMMGMMGGYGYAPYSYGYSPGLGMMNPGMMSGGMMGGYGYAPGFSTPFGYGYGSNSLLWIAVVILVGTTAYLLGKRSKS